MKHTWEQSLSARADADLAELVEFLRIPSVSTDPVHATDVRAAADWVAARLGRAGVSEVTVHETAGHPAVIGRWPVGPDRPTALIYGHYDVQPPEPLDLWETPPFEPTIRDGRLYARGASDMKGNLLTVIQAVEALAVANGAPPLNLVFLFEGEEEIGSPNLAPLIEAERERLACDYAISADGGMFGPDTPSLTVSLKGLGGCQIDLRTGSTDLHSGMYGAAVPNAIQALTRLVATLHDGDGRVAVAGFYDDVQELTAAERTEIAAIPFDESAYLDQAGVSTFWGEPGYSPLERAWARPTLDLNGIWGGFQGDGAKTVTPCEAHAKITCRLVARQVPQRIVELLKHHIAANCPPGATATVTPLPGLAHPFSIRRDHPALLAAGSVLRDLYGTDPLIVRNGGTIPVTGMLNDILGVETVLFAWSLPGSQAHAPNEWYRIEDFLRGRRAYASYLTALGR